MSDKRILVTGGAGYIGTLLVPMLLEQGYEVTLLDIFKWGVKPILHFASHPKCQVITGDVRDDALMKTEVPRHDMVFHLAGIVGYPACAADPTTATSTNVHGTENVVKNLSASQRMIYASTGSTYGKVDGICTEETPINPLSLYGSNKWEGEKMSLEAGGVGLRFATVFGLSPRLRLDLLINDFVYQAIHAKQIVMYEGHFRRTFLHARDAARAYLFTLDRFEEMRGRAFNVGDNQMNYTKRDIARFVGKYVEYYLHEADVGKDIDQRDYEVSYDRINKLGFLATVTLEDGVLELVKVLRHIKVTNEWRNI